MEAYFSTFDTPLESLSKELTVFYDEFGSIKDVVQDIVKEGCLGQRFKSYLGTILTDKTLDLTIKMIDDYIIYEYKHFRGFMPPDSSGGGSGPSPTPNYYGNKSNGNCITNSYTKGACNTKQSNTCDQSYAFPYYYYDLYLKNVANQHNVLPKDLSNNAVSHATSICNSVAAASWEDMSSPPSVTWNEIAAIFKANNPKHINDCANALIMAAGECQTTDDSNTKCESSVVIWQNPTGGKSPITKKVLNPDESAKNIYPGGPLPDSGVPSLCKGIPIVPKGFISEGNTNYLGPFCHVNQWGKGMGWGGGQCTGGL